MTSALASFYTTGGTLSHDAPSYVERQADHDLLDGLRAGEFCYVLTSRQMGKSSLMVRTGSALRESGVQVIALDLTAVGQNVTSEQWYDGLLAQMGRQLHLEEPLDEFWLAKERLGPCQRFFAAIRDTILRRQPEPLVIFVDEIDTVRSLPFSTDEFFAAIRECYNRRVHDSDFRRLSFCLLGVGTPSDLIRDTRTTPFNIGRRIELHDFAEEEAAPLALGMRHVGSRETPLTANSSRGQFTAGLRPAKRLLSRILYWTGGHPYLTQRFCRAVAESAGGLGTAGLDRICEELFLSNRAKERDDNLLFVRERLLHRETDVPSLLELYLKVLRGEKVEDDETSQQVSVLRLSGIVKSEEGRLVPRNRIYSQVFDRTWVHAHMPDADLRRQRAAFYRGVIRTTAIATVVVAALAVAVLFALKQAAHARQALAQSYYSQARVRRVSGLAGQRFEALEFLQQAAQINISPGLRNEAIACLALTDLRPQPSPLVPDKEAAALAISDDEQLYTFSNPSGEVVVRRVADDRELARWRAGASAVKRLLFSRDKQLLAVAQADRGATVLSLWRWSSAEKLFAMTNAMQAEAFDFSPDSRQLAVGDEKGMLQLLAVPGGQVRANTEFGESCSVLRFDLEGQRVAVASSASLKVGVYDGTWGNLVTRLHSASPPVHLAWHPNGRWIAAAGEDRRIRLWDIAADEFPKAEMPRQMSDITALAFSRSGDLLAAASADRSVRLWNAGLERPLVTATDAGNVHQLQFSPNDRRLGFVVSGGTIQFWDVAAGDECRTLVDFDTDELSAIDIHPNGRLLAAAHFNGVALWDLAQSRWLGQMPVGATASVRFHPLSGDLVNSEFRGTYRFRVETEDRPGGRTLFLKPQEDFYLGPGALCLDFARASDVLAVLYEDRVRLARGTNSAYGVLGELVGEPGFKTVALSPDGRGLAASNWKTGEVWLWDPAVPAKPRRLRVGGPARVGFSPDDRWLATGTERRAVLWDRRSWAPVVQVERSLEATRPGPVAFTQSARLWAVALDDSRVRLLEVSGRAIAELEAPRKDVLVGMVFSPDGSRLACATTARTVVVWNLDALGRGLAQLGLGTNFEPFAAARRTEPPMTAQIGNLDRLRFSQARHIIGLQREVAELSAKIQENPEAWHFYRYRAEKLQQLGNFEAAAKDYDQWIQLDRAATELPRDAKLQAWPLRDLARLYLFGSREVRDYEKARALTQEALELEPENPDNHYRHAVACFRLGRYEAAETHLEAARLGYEANKKSATAVLFYQAMCKAHQNNMPSAAELLEQAKRAYARTDLKYLESHTTELSDLLWEAERVVGEASLGG